MAVISTFDQWQKDVFFSAAEEVQESADTMESVYKMWVRERVDGGVREISDKLRRELHTTLGTTKWQLEEFEREVNLSHEKLPSDDNAITRHREFVSAIRNKISPIEKAISDSLLEEGKLPLRWVQLDEEESDDFENFLSMAPQNLQMHKEKYANHESVWGFKETVTISKDANYIVEAAAKETVRNQNELSVGEENLKGHDVERNSPDIDAWKIVVADEHDASKNLLEATQARPESYSPFGFLRSVVSISKLKWFRNSFGKAKSGEHIQSRHGFSKSIDLKRVTLFTQGINRLSERSRNCFTNQRTGKVGGGLQRHFQGSQSNRRSVRVALLLVLTVFLIAPFVLYST